MTADSKQPHIVRQDVIALGIQHHSLSAGRPCTCAAGGTKVHSKRFVGVLPQLIPKAFVFGPALQCGGRSKTGADNLHAECVEVVLEVAVPATFERSTVGVGRWIEPNHCWTVV